MFELASERKCWWPVELSRTTDECEVVKTRIRVQFKLLTRKELRGFAHALAADLMQVSGHMEPGDAPAQRSVGDVFEELGQRDATAERTLRERVCDWRDVVDQDGQPVPFGPEVLAVVMESEDWFQALYQALFDASRGARPKNSSPGPGGLPVRDQSMTATGSGTSEVTTPS